MAEIYLTAQHVDRVRHGELPVARGATHLRVPGERVTLCGSPALGWPILWHLSFGTDLKTLLLLTSLDCHQHARRVIAPAAG